MGVDFSRPPLVPMSFGDCFQNGNLDIFKHQVFPTQKRKREEEEDILIGECNSIYNSNYKMRSLYNGDYGDYDDDNTKRRYRYINNDKIIEER